MIPARAVEGWADLLWIAARRFDALANEAAPGTPQYLEFVSLAHRCADAAENAGYEADDARDAESAAEERAEQAAAAIPQAARPAGADGARAAT
jgi:hypothetical protein